MVGGWQLQVKNEMDAQTKESKSNKSKSTYIKLGVTAVILLIGLGGALFSMKPVPAEEKLAEVIVPVEHRADVRTYSETTLKILQYELFYRDFNMQTTEAVVFHALSDAIEMYALFDHLQQHDYGWDEDKRTFYREKMQSELAYDLKDPYFKTYFDKMLVGLDITEQQYIDEYLLVKKEYDMLKQDMFSKGIGLTNDGGTPGYESSNSFDAFIKKIGVDRNYLEYLAERMENQLPPLEPQPNLPFEQLENSLKVNKNPQGEYIFARKEFSGIDLTDAQNNLLYTIGREEGLPDFTRFSYPRYKNTLEEIVATNGQHSNIAQQLLEIFIILERTIEMTPNVELLSMEQTIPAFSQKQLRVHNELTVSIIEHELYYRGEDIPERSHAFIRANNEVISMYGLLNHLNEHSYSWDETVRQSTRKQLQQQLEQKLENPNFKAYFENLLRLLNITAADYIDHYLLLKEEYKLLTQDMYAKQIGLDKDGRFAAGEAKVKYQEAAGIDIAALREKMNDKDIYVELEKLDEQPKLPFELGDYPLEVMLNEDGEYVFLGASYLSLYLTEAQNNLLAKVQQKHQFEELSRYSLRQYMDVLQQFNGENAEIAQQLVEILTIFERTISVNYYCTSLGC